MSPSPKKNVKTKTIRNKYGQTKTVVVQNKVPDDEHKYPRPSIKVGDICTCSMPGLHKMSGSVEVISIERSRFHVSGWKVLVEHKGERRPVDSYFITKIKE